MAYSYSRKGDDSFVSDDTDQEKRMLLIAALILLVSVVVSILSYCMAPSQNYTHLYPQMYAQAKEPDAQEPQEQQSRIKSISDLWRWTLAGNSGNTGCFKGTERESHLFFVIGRTDKNDIAALKRIQAEGHSIGVHSYSHKYQQIYKSVEDYLDDFNDIEEWIFEITGEHTQIFRFQEEATIPQPKEALWQTSLLRWPDGDIPIMTGM